MGCDIAIRIGGQAGQGLNVLSGLIGKSCLREGLWVFAFHDVMSRIRGGHNFSQLRISDTERQAPSGRVDILVCLDKNTLELHGAETDGLIVYDSAQLPGGLPAGMRLLAVPLGELAKNAGGNAKMSNAVAAGAVLALAGLSLDRLLEVLGEMFSKKSTEVVEQNRSSARAGYDHVLQNYAEHVLEGVSGVPGTRRMLITGSEAFALGAIASGIRFYSAYPMSPSTGVMEYLAARQKEYGLVVEQAEDEIAAINMAIGASFAGARAMTGTSGGGLALMVEGISLAGMTETPVVILDAQRPAPATGFPTRTEQGDLLFVVNAGHGEFARAVFAPGGARDAAEIVGKAFHLAEKYQTPVFVLGDQYLNDSSWTVERIDTREPSFARQGMLAEDELKRMAPYSYRRYALTASGVSPAILPGTPGQVSYADSDEHTEEGHITESAQIREQMVEKRLRKLEGLRAEMPPPCVFPDGKADLYLVGWGSTLGILAEATDLLRNKGMNAGYIHFTGVYPLRKDAIPDSVAQHARLIAVENNARGQFASLLKSETGVVLRGIVGKYDGRPFTPDEVARRVEELK